VTVHNNNPASIRVALKNGGVIERRTDTRHLIWVPCRETQFIVRPAAQGDEPAIGCVYCEAWKSAYRGMIPGDYLDSLTSESCAPRKINPDCTLVCEANSRIAGVIHFGPRRDEAAGGDSEIYSVYVLPEYWRTGAGRALFQRAVREIRSQGYDRIFLWTLSENLRAISFCERMGMKPCGSRKIIIAGKELAETGFLLNPDG